MFPPMWPWYHAGLNQSQGTNILYIRIVIMPKPPSYHYVTHRDTEEQAYRINEGKFSGVVWLYEECKVSYL